MCLVIGNETWIRNLRIKTLHLNRLADRCFHSGPELYQDTDLVYPDDLLPRCCLLSLVDAVSAVHFESQLVLELICWLDIGYSVLGSVCFIWSHANSLEVYAVGIIKGFFFSNFVPYPLVPNDRHVRRQGHGCTVHTKVVYGPKESHDSTTFGQSIDPTKSHVNAAWLFSVYKKSPRNLGMILKRAMAAHLWKAWSKIE